MKANDYAERNRRRLLAGDEPASPEEAREIIARLRARHPSPIGPAPQDPPAAARIRLEPLDPPAALQRAPVDVEASR
ncbi:MAG TPA: hypothetical protein VFJ58_17270 [Armatimonadota bacterium]|nr:hypothetical protein [Armatimonadota bacterium]